MRVSCEQHQARRRVTYQALEDLIALPALHQQQTQEIGLGGGLLRRRQNWCATTGSDTHVLQERCGEGTLGTSEHQASAGHACGVLGFLVRRVDLEQALYARDATVELGRHLRHTCVTQSSMSS